jgi:serine/threonine protein kinase
VGDKAPSDDEKPAAADALSPAITPDSKKRSSKFGLSAGMMVGPYKVLSHIGQGGMGSVFRALHIHLDRIVALKVLPPGRLQRPEAVARFNREMKAVGKLNHPNIVQAFDAGVHDGMHFIAMEHIDGVDLSKLIGKHGPLPPSQAFECIREIAVALSVAHAAGLIHRDVKPSNIIRTQSGQIKLLDLGLARIVSAERVASELTEGGQPLGTPDYMSPEQWDDSRGVDLRTDLYSLGCTMFFLLTGRAPFATDEFRSYAGKMRAHLSTPPPDLSGFVAGLPKAVRTLYQRLMAKSPSDRPQSAKEVAELLVGPFTNVDTPSDAQADCESAIPLRAKVSPKGPSPKFVFAVAIGLLSLTLVIAFRKSLPFVGWAIGESRQGDGPAPPIKRGAAPFAIQKPATALKGVDRRRNDRQVIEKVLARGGTASIEPETKAIKNISQIPGSSDFAVISLEGGPAHMPLTNDDVQLIVASRSLRGLYFATQAKLDEVLPALAWLPCLQVLSIRGISGSPHHLKALAGRRTLTHLVLDSHQIAGDWSCLEPLVSLRSVEIYGTEHLAEFSSLPHLRTLHVNGGQVAEKDVAAIQSKNPQLRIFVHSDGDPYLIGTDPTREAALKLLNHGVRIKGGPAQSSLDSQLTAEMIEGGKGFQFGELSCDGDVQLNAEQAGLIPMLTDGYYLSLYLRGQQNGDVVANAISRCSRIWVLDLGLSNLTDEGLAELENLVDVRHLYLHLTKVTQNGIAEFRKSHPTCHVVSDFGVLQPDYDAEFSDHTK